MKILLNSDKVRREINRLGCTQLELAKKMRVSPQIFNYWLQSESAKHAKKIGKALDLDPRDLVVIK